LRSKFKLLTFTVVGLLLSVSATATPIKSDGSLIVNSKVFIDRNIELTEQDQSTLVAVNNEQNINAITLALIRSLNSEPNEYNQTTVASMYKSIAKIAPIKHVEVGWQGPNLNMS